MHTLTDELTSLGWIGRDFVRADGDDYYVRVSMWLLPPQAVFTPADRVRRFAKPKLTWAIKAIIEERLLKIDRSSAGEIFACGWVDDNDFPFDRWLWPHSFAVTGVWLSEHGSEDFRRYFLDYGALSRSRGVMFKDERP